MTANKAFCTIYTFNFDGKCHVRISVEKIPLINNALATALAINKSWTKFRFIISLIDTSIETPTYEKVEKLAIY